LNPFDIIPAACTVSYTCTSVARKDGGATQMTCDNFELIDGKLTITPTEQDYTDSDSIITPGVYVVTITGTADESEGPVSKDATVEITLLDPCDPPNSVTHRDLVDQSYRLADLSAPTYTHANYDVDPVYCLLTYIYSETKLTDGEGNADVTAISRDDKTFTFFYNKDDAPVSPVAQTQTVTVTATSDSKYETSYPKKSDFATFDLIFTDPCLSSSYSSVTETTQTSPSSDKYSASDLTFTYNAFEVNPAFCKTTVTCASA
jgi:hypothetical protein